MDGWIGICENIQRKVKFFFQDTNNRIQITMFMKMLYFSMRENFSVFFFKPSKIREIHDPFFKI